MIKKEARWQSELKFPAKQVLTDLLPIFLLSTIISFYLDKSVIRTRGIFPWDSRVYFLLSQKLFSADHFPISIDYPWGARVLFPALSGLIHLCLGLSNINAALLVNLISTFAVGVFCLWLWNNFKIRRSISVIGLLILNASYVGPLRSSIYYPGNGYAFECAICAITFLGIYWLERKARFVQFSIPILSFIKYFKTSTR
jgi:hypothetical protein